MRSARWDIGAQPLRLAILLVASVGAIGSSEVKFPTDNFKPITLVPVTTDENVPRVISGVEALFNVNSTESEDKDEPEGKFTYSDLMRIVKELESETEKQELKEKNKLQPGLLEMLEKAYDEDPDQDDYGERSTMAPNTSFFGDLSEGREGSDYVVYFDDLSDDEIVNNVAEGIEESLTLAAKNRSFGNDNEKRQFFSVYMFQGQYIPEPRLNKFVDGAIGNMRSEMRIALMDPLYFQVLPKGRVQSRAKPYLHGMGLNEPKTMNVELQAGSKLLKQQMTREGRFAKNKFKLNKRKRPGLKRRPNRNRKGQKNNRVGKRRRRPGKRRRNKKRRGRCRKKRCKRGVGGGRVEGLSICQRDGDAEMQVFGNYTLIRSHFRMGPVQLAMQFRTRRGLRRTSATLPVMKLHTVTRVNLEGSEMVDFLLDRPHPEIIEVRGRLFPRAKRVARNIFSRLFMPDSFLTSRLREKTGLALRARPRRDLNSIFKDTNL